MFRQMVTLNSADSFMIGGRIVNMKKKIRQYYEFEEVFVVRLDESDGNPSNDAILIGFHYAENNYEIRWEFPYDSISGIHPIIPELKKEEDFISSKHYSQYLEKYKGKELLGVYAGDYRYLIDANTGEVYDKMESR